MQADNVTYERTACAIRERNILYLSQSGQYIMSVDGALFIYVCYAVLLGCCFTRALHAFARTASNGGLLWRVDFRARVGPEGALVDRPRLKMLHLTGARDELKTRL
jgi:hypothetical protein